MIRTNLATRPFYNSRAVSFWIGLLGALAFLATAFNAAAILRYSGSNTELQTRASQDEATAAERRATAARLRGSVDTKAFERAAADAREANELIDRRTLSWTTLLNRFEQTLPVDVRIVSVEPNIDRNRRMGLVVTVDARSVEVIDQFMTKLDTLGAFRNLRSVQEQATDDGQIQSVLEMTYEPARFTPPAVAGTTTVGGTDR